MKRTAPPQRAVITTPTDREIRVERTFNATRDRVWQALTDPKLIAQWWSPSPGRLEVERMEVRRGGRWRFVTHGAKGPDGFEGRYREVTPPERLVYTFEWDGMPGHVAVETMILEDLGGGRTRVIAVQQFHTTEERDGMLQAGMQGGVDHQYEALDRVLEALAS